MALAVGAVALSSALTGATAVTPSGKTVTLVATSMTVSALDFAGCVDGGLAATACGSTAAALEFTASTAALTGLSESLPCQPLGGLSISWTAAAASASLPDAATIYAASFDSDQFAWSTTAPPTSGLPFSGTLTTVKIEALFVGTAAWNATSASGYASSCGPSPAAPAKPSPSPSPAASPSPSP